VTVVGASTIHVLMEHEQEHVFNEGLHDENIGEFSLDNDGTYMQLATPVTHVTSDSESDNGSNEQGEEK
jgi:hypothetical protein